MVTEGEFRRYVEANGNPAWNPDALWAEVLAGIEADRLERIARRAAYVDGFLDAARSTVSGATPRRTPGRRTSRTGSRC